MVESACNLTSGARQTKFPLLRRSNLSAAPGVKLENEDCESF